MRRTRGVICASVLVSVTLISGCSGDGSEPTATPSLTSTDGTITPPASTPPDGNANAWPLGQNSAGCRPADTVTESQLPRPVLAWTAAGPCRALIATSSTLYLLDSGRGARELVKLHGLDPTAVRAVGSRIWLAGTRPSGKPGLQVITRGDTQNVPLPSATKSVNALTTWRGRVVVALASSRGTVLCVANPTHLRVMARVPGELTTVTIFGKTAHLAGAGIDDRGSFVISGPVHRPASWVRARVPGEVSVRSVAIARGGAVLAAASIQTHGVPTKVWIGELQAGSDWTSSTARGFADVAALAVVADCETAILTRQHSPPRLYVRTSRSWRAVGGDATLRDPTGLVAVGHTLWVMGAGLERVTPPACRRPIR
jgi:hypothetical protein